MSLNSKNTQIQESSYPHCSSDKVKNFTFVDERDFLIDFMKDPQTYKNDYAKIEKLNNKFSSDLYLKHLQTFKETLMNELIVLKSKKIEKKKIEKIDYSQNRLKQIYLQNLNKPKNESKEENFKFFKAKLEVGPNGRSSNKKLWRGT